MDKYVKALCKQNPVMEINCGNRECKSKFKVKSVDFFRDSSYTHTCDKCGKSAEYDTSKFAKDLKKQLEQIGIRLR